MDFDDFSFDINDIEAITQTALTQQHGLTQLDEINDVSNVSRPQHSRTRSKALKKKSTAKSSSSNDHNQDHRYDNDSDDNSDDNNVIDDLNDEDSDLVEINDYETTATTTTTSLTPTMTAPDTRTNTTTGSGMVTTTRLQRLLDHTLDENHNIDQASVNPYFRDRKRPLQPLQQTFDNDDGDISYDAYAGLQHSRKEHYIPLNNFTSFGSQGLNSLQYDEDTLSFNSNTSNTTPKTSTNTNINTTPTSSSSSRHYSRFQRLHPYDFVSLGSTQSSQHNTPTITRLNQFNMNTYSPHSNTNLIAHHQQQSMAPHQKLLPNSYYQTNTSANYNNFDSNQIASFSSSSSPPSSSSSFPLLDDSLATFKPYYDDFLQYTLWGLNVHTLHPKLLNPLYQSCLRFKSVPIPQRFHKYLNWSEFGLCQNLSVINTELQFAMIPGLEEPSIQLLSILNNALQQRCNSHSMLLGAPTDLPLLCVGSVLAHILYHKNASKLNAVIIHLSGHITTNDTNCIQSLCLQLCEQLGLSCSLDLNTATFHDYAQFITLLLRQISTLDITDINTYDAKYNLYEHSQNITTQPKQQQQQQQQQHQPQGQQQSFELPTTAEEINSTSTNVIHAIPIIVVLDGFDHLAKTGLFVDDNANQSGNTKVTRQSFLYFLGDLAQTNQAWLHIIGIANSPTSYDFLEKRVKSRLPMQNVFLYNSLYQSLPLVRESIDKQSKLTQSDGVYNLAASHSIDIFADMTPTIERLQAILYSFLALPCEPIDNITPVVDVFPELFQTKTPQQDTNQTKGVHDISIAKLSSNTNNKSLPTHHDGSIPLINLPIIPRTWSPIDLTCDFTLPHWTQVFYYNVSLYSTLTSPHVVGQVLTPMVYQGIGLSQILSMVSKIVENMVRYPTLLVPNIPPVPQLYYQYCLHYDQKRKDRYDKYTRILSQLQLNHDKKKVNDHDDDCHNTMTTKQTSKFVMEKTKLNTTTDISDNILSAKPARSKFEKYSQGFKQHRVNGQYKYLSSWRGTSAIATVLLCPWDILTAYFHITQQITDYETSYCELHNELLAKPYIFSGKSIQNTQIFSSLYYSPKQNKIFDDFNSLNTTPLPSTPSSQNRSRLTTHTTSTPTSTLSAQSSFHSTTVAAAASSSSTTTITNNTDNPRVKQDYAIDNGFLSCLLRFFQSDLTLDSFFNHTQVQHETNQVVFNHYLNQVADDAVKFKQFYLPYLLSNSNINNQDQYPIGVNIENLEDLVSLYFPQELLYFQSNQSQRQTTFDLNIVSFSVEPDADRVECAHKQFQAYKKAQVKRRQLTDTLLADNRKSSLKQTSNNNKLSKSIEVSDLSTIFKMYLKSFHTNSLIAPTTLPPDHDMIFPTLDKIDNGCDSIEALLTAPSTPRSSQHSQHSQLSSHSGYSSPSSTLSRLTSTPNSQQSSTSSQHSRHGTPIKLRATPLTSSTSVTSKHSTPTTSDQGKLHEKVHSLHAQAGSFNYSTASSTLVYFQTESLLQQHLSTLSPHTLGLIAASLRLEMRGESAYSFPKLFEEHISFLHSWSLTQPNINPFDLFPTRESCSELFEQLIVDQFFVYCTQLAVDSKHTQQLNLDLFVTDDNDRGGSNTKRLAVIEKGSVPSHIISVHPLQHQLHSFVKSNNPFGPLGTSSDQSLHGGRQHSINQNDSNQQLLHMVKIQCVLTRSQFFNFLKSYKGHLNTIRYVNPLDYESVPVWLDSLLDTEIRTTTTV